MKVINVGITPEMRAEKLKATEGCDVCPCCGETRNGDDNEYTLGVSMMEERRFTKGLFKPVDMAESYYRCHTCGTTWKSEPYRR